MNRHQIANNTHLWGIQLAKLGRKLKEEERGRKMVFYKPQYCLHFALLNKIMFDLIYIQYFRNASIIQTK